MSKVTRDELWKGFVRKYYDRFSKSIFPQDAGQIDWAKKWQVMDKEMLRIFAEAKVLLRKGDLLLKVWLKNGEEAWILIHLEFQGYVDQDMGKRIDTCYYRIKEYYNRPVAIQVIYTDDDPNFNPDSHLERCLSTSSELHFPTFKLLNHPPGSLAEMDPLIAIIHETAWYGLRRNKLNDNDLGDLKFRLIRKLKEGGFDNETIQQTFGFIKHYLRFEKSKNTVNFEKKVFQLFKTDNNMELLEILKKAERQEIEELAEWRGEKRTIEIFKRLQNGESAKTIAKALEVAPSVVENIKKELGL